MAIDTTIFVVYGHSILGLSFGCDHAKVKYPNGQWACSMFESCHEVSIEAVPDNRGFVLCAPQTIVHQENPTVRYVGFWCGEVRQCFRILPVDRVKVASEKKR